MVAPPGVSPPAMTDHMSLVSLLPLVKLLAALGAMVLVLRRGAALAVAVLSGAVALGALFGLGPVEQLQAAGRALTSPELLRLALLVALIMCLSDLMDETRQGDRLMRAAARLIPNPRMRLAFFPMLIGLLPMPGGAAFSAPMLKNTGDGLGAPRLTQAMLNYWFRHVWEIAWPLYPAIILTSTMSGLPLTTLAILNAPGFFVSIWLGWRFFLRPQALALRELPPGEEAALTRREALCQALAEGAPILLALAGGPLLGALIEIVLPLPPQSGFLLGLVLGVAACAARNKAPARLLLAVAGRRRTWLLTAMILSVFIFREVMEAARVAEALAMTAGRSGALALSATLLPGAVGFVSGVSLAFVGASLPTLLELLEQTGLNGANGGGEMARAAWITLMLFSGWAGILISPLHACLPMTCEVFETPTAQGWRATLKPAGWLFVFGLVYAGVLGMLAGRLG